MWSRFTVRSTLPSDTTSALQEFLFLTVPSSALKGPVMSERGSQPQVGLPQLRTREYGDD